MRFTNMKKSIIPMFAIMLIFSLNGCTSTTKSEKIMDVNIQETVTQTSQVFDKKEEVVEEPEEKHLENVVAEKTAMHPEYIFTPTNRTYYALKPLYLKDIPYDSGRNKNKLELYEKITVTGRNELKYWEVEVDGLKYYIDSSKITDDTRYIFDSVNYKKYAARDTIFYETPYINDKIIDYPDVNTEVDVIGENDSNFYKVKVEGTEGYILKTSLMDEKINVDIKEDGIYTVHNQEELELIWAIVQQECGSSYEGALAVISSAANRCNSARWGYIGDTIYKQLTAPGQYCYSIDNYWQRWLGGNVNDCVKQAVSDGLNGKTNHGYTCFRSTNGGDPTRVNIGGNWYFGD